MARNAKAHPLKPEEAAVAKFLLTRGCKAVRIAALFQVEPTDIRALDSTRPGAPHSDVTWEGFMDQVEDARRSWPGSVTRG
jgi:hypothetical protein